MAFALDALEEIFMKMDQKLTSAEALLEQKCEENASRITQFQGDMSDLIASLDEDIRKLTIDSEVMKCNIDRKKDLIALHDDHLKRNDNQLCELEATQEAIEQERKQRATEEEDLKSSTRRATEKLDNLKTHLKLYKEYLGLDIKRSKQGNLMFVFVNINRDDPEETYFFQINLDGETYIVSDCCPKLKDLEQFVDQLNRDNDLGRFVCNVRKGFCAYAKKRRSEKPKSA